jgi:hypothetical protein
MKTDGRLKNASSEPPKSMEESIHINPATIPAIVVNSNALHLN